MKTEYESVLKEFMPALKARAAKLMSKDYKMKQEEIAKLLGTTQAAISKYLNGEYSSAIKEIESKFRQNEVVDFVKMAIGNDTYEAQRTVCKMCSRRLSFKCGIMIK